MMAEAVEWACSSVDGRRRGAGRRAMLEGLVEPFDLAVGLGVVGPGVSGADAHRGEGVGEDVAVRRGVVGQEPGRPADTRGGGGEHDEALLPGARSAGPARRRPAAVVIDDVEDLDLGAVGELPGGVVELPAVVGPLGGEAARGPLGALAGSSTINPRALRIRQIVDSRRQARQVVEVQGDRRRTGVEPGVDELFAFRARSPPRPPPGVRLVTRVRGPGPRLQHGIALDAMPATKVPEEPRR